jgi:hypothetical protein
MTVMNFKALVAATFGVCTLMASTSALAVAPRVPTTTRPAVVKAPPKPVVVVPHCSCGGGGNVSHC